MRKTTIAAGAILAVGLTTASEARAQYWLRDRALNEGRGIRAGNFEFHPGIGAEFGFDSNTFATPPNIPSTSSLRLRITPSIALSTLGPQRSANTDSSVQPTALPTANFRAQLALPIHVFFPLSSPDTVSRLSNLGINAGFRLELFPGRTWQFNIADDFTRMVQGGPEGGLSLAAFNRDVNRGNVELVFAPNGGILDVRIGYTNQVTIFESSQFSFFNVMQHEIAIRNRWRFLPKTALMFEGIVAPIAYFNTTGSPVGLFSGVPISGRFGLNGLFTERFGLLALVGFGATDYVDGDNAETVIAQVEARWIISPTSSLRLGLQRDIQPSFVTNYLIRNRAYLNWGQSFSGRFLVSSEISAGINQYGFAADPSGAPSSFYSGAGVGTDGRFNTVRIQASAFGEYRFSDVFGVNATVQYSGNIPMGDVMATAGMGGPLSIAWHKFEAFIGARVNW